MCSQTKLNEMITKKSYEQFSALLRIDVSVVEVGENIDTVQRYFLARCYIDRGAKYRDIHLFNIMI